MTGTLPFPATLTPLLQVQITGDPTGQGSMTMFSNGGKAYPKNTVNHRNWVIDRLIQEWGGRPPVTTPVVVRVVFTFRRPDSHYWPKANRRRARSVLRDDAPQWHAVKNRGDLDKLQRLLGDGLEISRVLDHDSLIVRWVAEKPYGETGMTSLQIHRP